MHSACCAKGVLVYPLWNQDTNLRFDLLTAAIVRRTLPGGNSAPPDKECYLSKDSLTASLGMTQIINNSPYQNISLRVPRSRQAQKEAILLSLKLRRLPGHIRKKQSNRTFVSWVPRGVDKHPALALHGKCIKKLSYCKNKDSCAKQNRLFIVSSELL